MTETTKNSKNKFDLQDAQYEFPYHHLAHFDEDGAGSRFRDLRWAYEYLCYQGHVRELVRSFGPTSLLDVGCGDGFLLRILRGLVPQRAGVDLSERAISYAKAFNPEARIELIDAAELEETFDVVTAIEVLEHIPDNDVARFLQTLAARCRRRGQVIISVPTVVSPLADKHFRHYDISLFEQQLIDSGAPLTIKSVEYIYKKTRLLLSYLRWTNNRYWHAEIEAVRKLIWQYVWHFVRPAEPENGLHMVVVLERR